jgi:hypothetical protein
MSLSMPRGEPTGSAGLIRVFAARRKKSRWFPCLLLAAVFFPGTPRCEAADVLETAQRTAIEWVKLREETARLENEWAQERDLMQATIPALEARWRMLEEKRKLTEEQTATARREVDDEGAKARALAASLEKSKERLQQASAALLQMRPSLPPRLSRALELPFASLADEALSPAERMRTVITVLDRCAQFNGAITLSEEALVVDGAGEKVMEVLYWGLARAYAVDRAGKTAYVGRPSDKRWIWEAQPEAVEKISAAMAVYRDQMEPRFLTLPVKMDRENGAAPKGN